MSNYFENTASVYFRFTVLEMCRYVKHRYIAVIGSIWILSHRTRIVKLNIKMYRDHRDIDLFAVIHWHAYEIKPVKMIRARHGWFQFIQAILQSRD